MPPADILVAAFVAPFLAILVICGAAGACRKRETHRKRRRLARDIMRPVGPRVGAAS